MLAGCSQPPGVPQEAPEMGNAEPAKSPPAGDVEGEKVDFPAVEDLEITNGTIGVRADGQLRLGTLDEIKAGGGATHQVDDTCGDVTANEGAFVTVCGGTVRVFEGAEERTVTPDEPVTVAAPLPDGRVIAGSAEEAKVWVFDTDGNQTGRITVARPSDFVLAGQDRVVRLNRFDTTIQDIQLDKARQGGTLRVGLGVGQAKFGEDGLVLASDSTGSQLLVYTTDEVVRLHQTVPTDPHPWAVAWDPANKLAWITSTEKNTATAFDISKGVPREQRKVDTVADAQHMISLDDGTLLLASASGDGLQIVTPESDKD
nr:hypothetical protein [Corynebacterium sp. Marseille-P3884]